VNDADDHRATDTFTLSMPNSIYLVLRAFAKFAHSSESAVVERALERFLDIVESCDPEARAMARSLSETNE
jgi:hypothetical protein